MIWFYYLIVFVFGAVFGSFIGAWTYRLPRKIKISQGRSFCPKCEYEIAWYDKIPLVSYIVLAGKCKNCHKQIGFREPLIEIATTLTFILIFYFVSSCATNFGNLALNGNIVCEYYGRFGWWSLPYFLTVTILLIATFVIDLEKKIIPDEFSYTLFFLVVIGVIFANFDNFFARVFLAFAPSIFLLFLHFVTRGRGMGLGDVKLVLFAPILLGTWQNALIWMMGSFIIGAIVGVIFMIFGKASFGKQIPFGPFLIISFFITLLFSDIIGKFLII